MDIEELLEEAKKSFEKGELKETIMYLETVLEIDMVNYEALYRLMRLYTSINFFDKALEYGKIANKYYSDSTEIIFSLGYIYQSIEKYKKAISYYKKYLEENEDYYVILNIGICYTELRYYKKALASFNKAIEMDKENPSAFIDKAQCLVSMKKYDDAILLYEKVLIMDYGNDSFIYFKIGEAKLEKNEIDEAIKNFNIAISFDDTPDMLFEDYFNILLDLKRYDEMELFLLNYGIKDVSREKALNLEGKYATEIKDFKRAEKVCEKLLLLNNENPIYYLNSAYVYEMQNQFDKALEFVEKGSEYVKSEKLLEDVKKRILKSKRKYNKEMREKNSEIIKENNKL